VTAATPAAFRRAALALPGVVEGAHHGHADFRAHGRVIASLHPDGERAMVKVSGAVQRRLVAAYAGACEAASGAWGRAGCTMLRLAALPPDAVREALAEAWQFGAAAAGSKGKAGPASRAVRAPRKRRNA
jgi:hypothetical protein